MLVRVGGREYAAAEGAIYGILGEAAEFLKALRHPEATLLEYDLDRLARRERERQIAVCEQARRAGKTWFVASHDETLLERLADEIWWVEGEEIRERGAPETMLARYRAAIANEMRAEAEGTGAELKTTERRGDGRASIEKVELLGEAGQPAAVWRSGETVEVRVSAQFAREVSDPVIGMLIRTRVGLSVYGTNTELEGLHFGPVAAHNAVRLGFRFVCNLCPGEYTLTVASHDPDGTWHDWLEDAVAFSVTDSRYTAGVANLRAQVALIGG